MNKNKILKFINYPIGVISIIIIVIHILDIHGSFTLTNLETNVLLTINSFSLGILLISIFYILRRKK